MLLLSIPASFVSFMRLQCNQSFQTLTPGPGLSSANLVSSQPDCVSSVRSCV